MELNNIFNGIIIGFSASVPLGPIGILCIQKTINKGHISGLVSGAGAALADTFYAIVAGFGLTVVTDFIEEQQMLLRILGSIMLLLLGIKIFYTNPAIQLRKQRAQKNLFGDLISIFFLTLSNPMTVFFFGAIFVGFGVVKGESSLWTIFSLVIGVFLGAAIWWSVLTTLVNVFRKKFRLKRLWWINKIAGAMVVGFAVIAIISLFFVKY